MQCSMPLRVSSIDITSYRRAVHNFMSLDCSLTVLRRTRLAGGRLLLSHNNRLTAITRSFRRLSMVRQMVWWACSISLEKVFFHPLHTLLVLDPFFNVTSFIDDYWFGSIRCIFPRGLYSRNAITHWLKCKSIQHATEKCYVVVLLIHMYKSQTMNIYPRVLH